MSEGDDREPSRHEGGDRRRPRRTRPRWLPWFALLLAFALISAACSDDDGATTDASADTADDGGSDSGDTDTDDTDDTDTDDTDDGGSDDGGSDDSAGADPVSGGELVIGQFSPARSFDPIAPVGAANGAVGGLEMRALYDTVMSWDPATGDYLPRTAESMEPNDDFTLWTLVLKDGVTFTDGTAYDAEAVKVNVERHMAETSRSGSRAALASFVGEITVVDPLTVEFTLLRPWTGFPYLFTTDVGMIASPTAIEAAGDDFGSNPGMAGAGPFVLTSSTPGESMVFDRNENYHGGEVYLDRITFVPTGAEEATYEAVRTGELDGAYFRSALAMSDAGDDGLTTIVDRIPAGNVLDINAGVYVVCDGGQPAGCEGVADGESVQTAAPGSDLRVRQAIAAAIDTDQVNQRAYDGVASAGSALFQPDFPLSPAVDGPAYDPDRAADLVEQAKAAGWDGQVRLYSVAGAVGEGLGLSVSAMLTAAGMEVDLDSTYDPPGLILEVLVNRNYDLVIWGSGITENPDANLVSIEGSYSTAASQRGFRGFSSAAMDEGIAALRVAETDDEVTAAYGLIAEAWNTDVPAVALNELQIGLITRPDLQGVVRTSNAAMFLDKAWLAG